MVNLDKHFAWLFSFIIMTGIANIFAILSFPVTIFIVMAVLYLSIQPVIKSYMDDSKEKIKNPEDVKLYIIHFIMNCAIVVFCVMFLILNFWKHTEIGVWVLAISVLTLLPSLYAYFVYYEKIEQKLIKG